MNRGEWMITTVDVAFEKEVKLPCGNRMKQRKKITANMQGAK
jgi:hypothetical protein